jgi:hypothetical protein
MPNGLRLRVFQPITDKYSEGDVLHGQTRNIPTAGINDVLVPPGTTAVDQAFWQSWLDQYRNADVVKRGLIYRSG